MAALPSSRASPGASVGASWSLRSHVGEAPMADADMWWTAKEQDGTAAPARKLTFARFQGSLGAKSTGRVQALRISA